MPEPPTPTRNDFRRDCDRIIHSAAFRRLAHKTQVFVFHEGDHFRTRLTHTLEVAQIARSLARALGLDEDLAEALALAHDLGHPPFGHAGERALDRCLADYGGFDHNAQTLRVVTALERRYADFDGLNLTWETLEGLVKHNGPLTDRAGQPIGRYRERGLPQAIKLYGETQDLELWSFASAEAQVAAIADDIAYDAHDIDDGLRADLFTLDDLDRRGACARDPGRNPRAHQRLDAARMAHELVRRLITRMIEDVIAETGRRLRALAPRLGRRRASRQRPGRRVLAGDGGGRPRDQGLSLPAHVPACARHAHHGGGGDVVCDLFARYAQPAVRHCRRNGPRASKPATRRRRMRRIADFIAGMTDRYALVEHAGFLTRPRNCVRRRRLPRTSW